MPLTDCPALRYAGAMLEARELHLLDGEPHRVNREVVELSHAIGFDDGTAITSGRDRRSSRAVLQPPLPSQRSTADSSSR